MAPKPYTLEYLDRRVLRFATFEEALAAYDPSVYRLSNTERLDGAPDSSERNRLGLTVEEFERYEEVRPW